MLKRANFRHFHLARWLLITSVNRALLIRTHVLTMGFLLKLKCEGLKGEGFMLEASCPSRASWSAIYR